MDKISDDLAEKFIAIVREGRPEELRLLISESPELCSIINEPLFDFNTPAIVFASMQKSIDLVEALLDTGADINARSSWWAGGFGVLPTDDSEMAQFLISRGAVIDIHAAAGMGMTARLEELIKTQPDLINARGGDGKTPLHFASSIEIASLLLQSGAKLEMRDLDHGATPAQYAVRDHPDVCRYLIAQGARSDIFMLAALGDLEGVQKKVTEDAACLNWRTGSWLEEPAPGGHIYIYMLGGGLTPLQTAAKFGHSHIADWLCAAGAEMDIFTAWDLGRPEQIRQILAADPELLNRPIEHRQGTWMHEAVFKGDAGLFAMLMEFDPDLTIQDSEYHSTPEGWAAHFGNSAILDVIEKHRGSEKL